MKKSLRSVSPQRRGDMKAKGLFSASQRLCGKDSILSHLRTPVPPPNDTTTRQPPERILFGVFRGGFPCQGVKPRLLPERRLVAPVAQWSAALPVFTGYRRVSQFHGLSLRSITQLDYDNPCKNTRVAQSCPVVGDHSAVFRGSDNLSIIIMPKKYRKLNKPTVQRRTAESC